MGPSRSTRAHPFLVVGALLLLAAVARAGPEASLRIAGRVVDDTGEPVPDYPLQVAPPAGVTRYGYEPPGATTDALGRFAIEGLVPGRYTLFVRGTLPTDGSDTHARMDPLRVRAGTEDVDVRVLRYRTIEGTAVDPDGKPLAGSEVLVGRRPRRHHGLVATQTPGREMLQRTALVDAEGRFRIERYPSDQPVEVRVSIPYQRAREMLPILVTDVVPGDEVLALRAPVALPIEGTVRDEHGAPVAGAVVKSRGPSFVDGHLPLVHLEATGTTDEAGHFELRPFPPGVRVGLYVAGARGAEAPCFFAKRDDVPTGARDVVIEAPRAYTLRGRVTGVPPAALEDCKIKVLDAPGHAEYRFDGKTASFRLNPVPQDLVRLGFSIAKNRALTGPRERKILVEAPAEDVTIEVAVAYTLRVRVRAPAGAGPLQLTYYDAWGRHHNPTRGRAVGETVEFVGVPAGGGQLFASTKDGKLRALTDDVDPTAGTVDLELAAGAPIRGRIQGLPGDVEIGRVLARRGLWSYGTRLAPDGSFETEVLPAGRWNLEFDVGIPLGGIVPTLRGIEAGATDVVASWSPDP